MMKVAKKVLCSTLMLACAALVAPANAQTQEDTTKARAVLFKIHDIKPALNADGVVTHCDFMTTFYNRSSDSLRYAKLEMGWSDKVSEQYLIDEEKEADKNAPEQGRRNNNKKEEVKIGDVTTVVDMPALGSHKQVSVKSSVKTNKCFMLLDNLEFKVNSCALVGAAESLSNRRRSDNTTAPAECAQLFEYVASDNPEYHDEFKDISYSEQERLVADEKKQDISDLEKIHEQVVSNLEKAQKVLKDIQ